MVTHTLKFLLLFLCVGVLIPSESQAQSQTFSHVTFTNCTVANEVPIWSATATVTCNLTMEFNGTTNVLSIGNTSTPGQIAAFGNNNTAQLYEGHANNVDDLNIAAGPLSVGSASGAASCTDSSGSGTFYTTLITVGNNGDVFTCSGAPGPFFEYDMNDNTANHTGAFTLCQSNLSDCIGIGTTTTATTTCEAASSAAFIPALAGPCSFFISDLSGTQPLAITYGNGGAHPVIGLALISNGAFMAVGNTTPVKYFQVTSTGANQATLTLGDTNAASVTNIRGGSAANTQANGVPIDAGNVATTTSLGGSALVAGACSAVTVAVTGLTTSMDVHATPQTYPGDGNWWEAYASAAGTATVKVCASVAGTPTASLYNVRVIQ
jgi:hypothetical protein